LRSRVGKLAGLKALSLGGFEKFISLLDTALFGVDKAMKDNVVFSDSLV